MLSWIDSCTRRKRGLGTGCRYRPPLTQILPLEPLAVHEQAMKRLTEATGLVPVDFLLVLETSEELIPANAFRHLIRVLGEREY